MRMGGMDGDQDGWAPIEGDAAHGAPPPPPSAPLPPPPPGWGPPPTAPGWQPPPGFAPLVDQTKAGDARTGPLPMHPMTVGDVLDGSFKLFKANARTLILVTAAVVVPLQIVSSFALRGQFQFGVLDALDAVNDPTVAQSIADQQQGSGAEILLGALTAFLGLLVTPFVAGAVSRVVADSYLGRELAAGDALRAAARRFPALLGAFVLVHLAELGGFLLCVLPALALMAMYTMVAPAIAIEELGPIEGMRRSWRLARPRFWPVLGISLLAGFIANALGQILGTIPTLFAIVLGGSFAWVGVAVAGTLTQIISLPIVTIAATLLYFDGRIRHEGFDLQIMASDLAGVRARP